MALVLKPQLEKMKILIKKKEKKKKKKKKMMMMMMMMMEILLLFLLLMVIKTLAADAPTPCESREQGIFELLKPRLLLLLAHKKVHPPTTIATKFGACKQLISEEKKNPIQGSWISCVNSRGEPKKSCGGRCQAKAAPSHS